MKIKLSQSRENELNQKFEIMHRDGAKKYGMKWLSMNETVLWGFRKVVAECELDESTPLVRCFLTSIAFMCLERKGKEK